MRRYLDFSLGVACALGAVAILIVSATSGTSERGSGRSPLNSSIYATDSEETPDPGKGRQERPRTEVANTEP